MANLIKVWNKSQNKHLDDFNENENNHILPKLLKEAVKYATVNWALQQQHLISHNPGTCIVLKVEMIQYFCHEKAYRLLVGDGNTDENHKVKNHLLSQKFH